GNGLTCSKLFPHSTFLLIHERLVPANLTVAHPQHQVPELIPANSLRSANVELDVTWVGSRRHNKVILKLPLVAVVNQINARINSLVLYLRISRNIRPPLRRFVA